eukprot:12913733-Alexandrium_andersonii.AAC.1
MESAQPHRNSKHGELESLEGRRPLPPAGARAAFFSCFALLMLMAWWGGDLEDGTARPMNSKEIESSSA